jgi:hypothetical protein
VGEQWTILKRNEQLDGMNERTKEEEEEGRKSASNCRNEFSIRNLGEGISKSFSLVDAIVLIVPN